MDLLNSGIGALREALEAGRLSAEALIEAHLARIAERDAELGAFVYVDPEGARRAAVAPPRGLLAGLPFGVKDVLDVAGMPCEQGSALYAGHVPPFDAGSVAQFRRSGAIVLGKTATAEFAGTAPPATVNPLDGTRTPGGSSSGSAAAVAAGMAVFALGTQTGGSVLRPAAFCGVAGFKPTFGAWPVSGMLPVAHSFDTVGAIARSADDLTWIHAAMMNHKLPSLPDALPVIGLCRTHLWDTVSEAGAGAIEAVRQTFSRAGAKVVDLPQPPDFADLTQHRAIVNAFERNRNAACYADQLDRLRPETRAVIARGEDIDGETYFNARRALDAARASLGRLFGEAGVLLTPVVPDVAPEGLCTTGDPRLQELWSTLRCPSIAVPFGHAPSGLPLSVQLVARPSEDALLLDTARQLEKLREGRA